MHTHTRAREHRNTDTHVKNELELKNERYIPCYYEYKEKVLMMKSGTSRGAKELFTFF